MPTTHSESTAPLLSQAGSIPTPTLPTTQSKNKAPLLRLNREPTPPLTPLPSATVTPHLLYTLLPLTPTPPTTPGARQATCQCCSCPLLLVGPGRSMLSCPYHHQHTHTNAHTQTHTQTHTHAHTHTHNLSVRTHLSLLQGGRSTLCPATFHSPPPLFRLLTSPPFAICIPDPCIKLPCNFFFLLIPSVLVCTELLPPPCQAPGSGCRDHSTSLYGTF
jgi:hypothetical protein